MAKGNFESLQRELDNYHDWPAVYYFKFIVPNAQMDAFSKIYEGFQTKVRPSRKGNYIGITIEKTVQSSAEVIAIYRMSEEIEGVITL